jgi:hypothetical protein
MGIDRVRPAVGHLHVLRRPDRDPVLRLHLLHQQLAQPRQPRRRQVVRVVVVERLANRVLERVRRVEGHVALIEAERILDGVHHVADTDDGGERDGVVEGTHLLSRDVVVW